MPKLGACQKKFITKVFADNVEQMLQILAFDFCKYGKKFDDNKEQLKSYLQAFEYNGRIELEMVHWMFFI